MKKGEKRVEEMRGKQGEEGRILKETRRQKRKQGVWRKGEERKQREEVNELKKLKRTRVHKD